MSRRTSASAQKPYGVRRVCRAWGVSPSTFYAWRKRQQSPQPPPRRRGPQGPMSDEALVKEIRVVIKNSPFTAEGYRKVHARLRSQGIRTSKERVRRLMREHALQAPVRKGRPRGPQNHDGKITTDAPNIMWGTDMTTTVLANGQQACVFATVDHHGIYCLGIHASEEGTRWEALEPVRQGVRTEFGALGKDVSAPML